MKKNSILWVLFFIICFGVGLFHGTRPKGLSSEIIFPPTSISVIVTDEVLLPQEIRRMMEEKLAVRFNVIVTRDWEALLVKLVESPSVDLIVTPSYWSHTLQKQNLLSNFEDLQLDILRQVSPDFLKSSHPETTFFPLYWMKSVLSLPPGVTFKAFAKNKNLPLLYLLADEDLILAHLKYWKEQGLLEDLLQKKILVHPLEQVLASPKEEGVQETALHLLTEPPAEDSSYMSALLVWGASIPQNSMKKKTTLRVLNYLASAELQEKWIEESPFSSCLTTLADKKIPLNRKAEWIRDLKLNETIIIEDKDIEALKKLREDYKINIL